MLQHWLQAWRFQRLLHNNQSTAKYNELILKHKKSLLVTNIEFELFIKYRDKYKKMFQNYFLWHKSLKYLPSSFSGLIRWAAVQRAWLASSAAWVRLPLLPACQVRFLSACYEIKFSGRYRGLASVLLKCDRPSHVDWGRLGVVTAAGMDNRWKVPGVL